MLQSLKIFFIELCYFTYKEALSCLFAGSLFIAIILVPKSGIGSIPRYDALLLISLILQVGMVLLKRESWDELKAITIFHLLGFCLEVFKTSSHIRSWSYPDFAYTKILGVPLFSGFMYAAVGSYIIQAWRLFELRIIHHPPHWMSGLIALLIYSNFFTHHFIGDYRFHLAACALGLYARTTVIYKPYQTDRSMPLLLSFILIGFFIWLAENYATFFGIWAYPHQLGAWSAVHTSKWTSWSLLVIMTFTIVSNLKHIKQHIDIPE